LTQTRRAVRNIDRDGGSVIGGAGVLMMIDTLLDQSKPKKYSLLVVVV
jgi:hypothetical protein